MIVKVFACLVGSVVTMEDLELEQRGISVIRGIAMDAPERAHSGHPGTAMALAPLAHVLWTRVMRYDPSAPDWPDRDRFVLSAGHASVLLYTMLYLTGYGLSLDDLRSFRQWGSITPGHPEVGITPGVEVTTGPLGQGFTNAVGMAIAERRMRARFGEQVSNHHIFTIASDGDFEEGISHEAASLAGHLGLDHLVCVYDNNHITIDGPTSLSYSDDVAGRFTAYGWNVIDAGEIANDLDAIEDALRRCIEDSSSPSLVILRSHIGWPSPRFTDTSKAHGDPFGTEEVRATKQLLGLPPDSEFWVPDDVLAFYRSAGARGRLLRDAWAGSLPKDWGDKDRSVFHAFLEGKALDGWHAALPVFSPGDQIATRQAINVCINATSSTIPALATGAADLTGNTGMALDGAELQSREHPGGSQIAYGIREHAMGGIMNGMALHGGALPVGGTFFIFSDYMRGSVRLAALSSAHVIYSWTHDSIGLGEDGPTHQPVEHLASMRAMPGLRVIRPADANECARAWQVAVDSPGPTALILSRQKVPVLDGTSEAAKGLAMGAYVLADMNPHLDDRLLPDVIIIGTGSEVWVCIEAAKQLRTAQSVWARVVSMPCWELFEEQDLSYREEVLPASVPTLAIEAASSFGWDRYAAATVSIDRFGSSAPGQINMERFGFTAGNVAKVAYDLISASNKPANRKDAS
ncbi:MAG: transketolase [Acidimicrobiales bacterium]